MPKAKRKWYPGAIYHVISRGVRRTPIFLEKKDFQKFLSILNDVLHYSPFKLHAYCLMTNHYHLMIGTKHEPLSKIMHSINSNYANWFNYKYDLSGHVFENRYTCQPIPSDYGFMITSAYIHNNPRSAGIHPENYPWSSYHHYVKPIDEKNRIRHPTKNNKVADRNELFQIQSQPANWYSHTLQNTALPPPPIAFTKERHQQLFPIPLHIHYKKFVEKEWKLNQIQKNVKE